MYDGQNTLHGLHELNVFISVNVISKYERMTNHKPMNGVFLELLCKLSLIVIDIKTWLIAISHEELDFSIKLVMYAIFHKLYTQENINA